MRYETATPAGTCGVEVWYHFDLECAYRDTRYSNSAGGIGYSIAGFVNTNTCKRAYEELKARFEIVFQSPVRRNRNSGNQFFFCVYKER